MSRRLTLYTGIVFFILAGIYAGDGVVQAFEEIGIQSYAGWTARRVDADIVVFRVDPAGPAAALEPGDLVVSINGMPIERQRQVLRAFHDIGPGETYRLVIRRELEPVELNLRSEPLPLVSTLLSAARMIILAIFLAAGFAIFILKHYDKQAVLLALMFATFNGAISAIVPDFAGKPGWMTAVYLLTHLVSLFFWPVFFHFFLIFPESSPLLKKFPRLEGLLYVPHLLTLFPFLGGRNVLAAVSPASVEGFSRDFALLGMVGLVLAGLYVAAGLLSLLVNYQQAGTVSRRKMRVVVAGSIAGFFPMFLAMGLGFMFDLPRQNPDLMRWLVFIALFAFPIFPLSFAYAIVRHQVIPVRIILRRGVRYLLVSRGFIIVQAVVVFALLSFLLTGDRIEAIDALGARADIFVTMAATATAIVLLTLLNQRVMPRIDRRFFREAYDAQQILSELGAAMRSVTAIEHLLELAVRKIQQALNTENVAILLLSADGDFPCAVASRMLPDRTVIIEPFSDVVLPGDGVVSRRARQSLAAFSIEHRPRRARDRILFLADEPVDPAVRVELDTLRSINSALIVPIATKDQLVGLISLGPRLGDLPFSREDRQLLTAVAWQMAVAIQNAQLVQQIALEERLKHELDLATTVQQRLFPQSPPETDEIELSGICYPARGVGGDYYDFIPLGGGRTGIAVADVAGKGISAALLMSTVQASLRSQAPSIDGRLTELVSSMNRLLHLSTDASSFASFFYAQFDATTRHLTYVNAGHNPPILVRSQSEETDGPISLLSTGGVIIGAFHASCYEQETVSMKCGDLLVAYTDGITEAQNVNGEEFGEERLRELVARHSRLSAHDLLRTIVDEVDGWSKSAPQHDDLTLVVLKVKG